MTKLVWFMCAELAPSDGRRCQPSNSGKSGIDRRRLRGKTPVGAQCLVADLGSVTLSLSQSSGREGNEVVLLVPRIGMETAKPAEANHCSVGWPSPSIGE